MGKWKVIVVLVLFVGAGGLFWAVSKPDAKATNNSQDVLAKTTAQFDQELQDCLDYNQQMYEHDKQKIERGRGDAKSNPKEVRLADLAEWYEFEQNACREFYEDRLKTLEATR